MKSVELRTALGLIPYRRVSVESYTTIPPSQYQACSAPFIGLSTESCRTTAQSHYRVTIPPYPPSKEHAGYATPRAYRPGTSDINTGFGNRVEKLDLVLGSNLPGRAYHASVPSMA